MSLFRLLLTEEAVDSPHSLPFHVAAASVLDRPSRVW